MVRHRRKRLAAATAGVALLALVMSAAATSAHPVTDRLDDARSVLDGLPDDAQELLADVAGGDAGVPLTLITGDQVVVGLDDDGAPVVQDIVVASRTDGSQPVLYTIMREDRVYVVPSDAMPLIDSDVLDWELFNVAELAEHVAAGTVGAVPVIVTYPGSVAARRAPQEMPGATVERTFTSIAGSALTIDGDGDWWRQVLDTQARAHSTARSADLAAAASRSGPLAGVEKVWLDELAEIHLAESVPKVGAPAAWDQGFDGTGVTVAVLDTGIDADHPDVADKVVDMVDFTDNLAGPVDGHGHGTHVAATILGTGAAADGLRPGVAPGADLLVGKVCSDAGQCAMSDVIEGMEWAAASGARVVNLSLGGDATDGTDPQSMALNEISARHDTLFVVSAGNDGPGSYRVSSPATADAALAVAAVDKHDQMANFSSRGPRVGDGALKPEIAAPGVGIVAARAAGTAMGTPLDDLYTSADGTSMAAPHVAGGAAILAQQHPEMSSEHLKALLMGTAVDLGHDIYAQGAGRMDLGRAVNATVFASGPVGFGALPYPHQQPATGQARFVNITDEPVTLSLDAEFADGAGNPAPDGLFTMGANEVTVPAHGDVTVDITVDGSVLTRGGLYGRYTGQVSANDETGTQRGSVLVSAFLEEERFPVDVRIVGADPSAVYGDVLIVPMDDQTHLHNGPVVAGRGSEMTAELFDGTYAISAAVSWTADGVQQTAMLMAPEVVVAGDTSVTLDVSQAQRFGVDFPEPLDVYDASVDVTRTSVGGDWGLTASLTTSYSGTGPERIEPNWWLLPTDPVDLGTLSVATGVVWIPELTTLRVLGGGRAFDLDARYATADVSDDGSLQVWPDGDTLDARAVVQPIPRLVSQRPLPLVHAGTGTADELAAAEVAGKLVLLTPADICGSFTCPYEELHARVEAAAELGAVGALIAGPDGHVYLPDPPAEAIRCLAGPDSCPPVPPYSSIPVLSVPAGDAATLAERLAARDAVRIDVGGDGTVSEAYAVPFVHDRVPTMPYRLDSATLHRTTHRIHAGQPGETKTIEWTRAAETPGQGVVRMRAPRVATPAEFTLHVPAAPAGTVDQFHVAVQEFAAPNAPVVTDPELNSHIVIHSGERRLVNLTGAESTYTWNSGPHVPGASPTSIGAVDGTVTPGVCSGCREGDTFWPTIHLTTSAGDPTTTVTGLDNDTGAGVWLLDANGCVDCEITLSGPTGEALTPTVTPLIVGTGSILNLEAPGDGAPRVFLDGRWHSIDTEVAR
ncbi:S8 family peptidase [Jiangella rhizosphaerae]|uniref:Peptidase S8/S53 domain-containing protein n=1 Tax=Jiangella rhizosphaerae TaxID=2293569 RepID=A0A418KRY3_9ACTN|nr:S8 family serine peptidase [Jiangella rhizosphaerae]RIQ24569.1 hypothetical protein DY240_11855 [Jiangella rhizosphaerae]